MNDNDKIRNALGAELHAEFEMWGRCMRPSEKAGTSPTYEICQRLATIAGVVQVVAVAGMTEHERVVAEEIERAWSFTQHEVRWKIALASYYSGLSVPVIARRVKAPLSNVVHEIVACAKATNRTRVNIRANGVPEDNRAYNSLTG